MSNSASLILNLLKKKNSSTTWKGPTHCHDCGCSTITRTSQPPRCGDCNNELGGG